MQDAIKELKDLSKRLGIHFEYPGIIVESLCDQRMCSSGTLAAWLRTEAAYEFLRKTYGQSYPLFVNGDL